MINNMTTVKYWSCLVLFSASILFWCQRLWLALH
ncbi:small membrane protein YmiC [Enterobacter hormaechei]|nr:small membrane protein YmiC [Enterobacter hormaechei]